MNWQAYIESDPNILFGNLVIKGTRIPVKLILEKLGNKILVEDLLQAYPHLTKEDVKACIFFNAYNINPK